MNAPATCTLDLQEVIDLLGEAMCVAGTVHGTETPVDPDRGAERRNNADLAELSRDLLRLSDVLQLAAAEASQAYWQLKGYLDPRGGQ